MNTLAIMPLFIMLFSLVPLIMYIFLLIWIHSIKTNTERQVEQNEQIIRLLNDMNNKTKNPQM